MYKIKDDCRQNMILKLIRLYDAKSFFYYVTFPGLSKKSHNGTRQLSDAFRLFFYFSLTQTRGIRAITHWFFEIYCNSFSHLRERLRSTLLSYSFPTKILKSFLF